MSVCAHDIYCPGYGPDHDIAMKTGAITERPGRKLAESEKGRKRRERAERNGRARRIW